MRKSALTVAALAVCAVSLVAEEVLVTPASTSDVMLNVRDYSKLFLNGSGLVNGKYSRAASREDRERVASLSSDNKLVDTPLEIALLSSCAGVVDIRPVAASNMLGNAKQADLKFGAAVFQEIQILRFLGNTAAVGLHEGELKFITDKGNVSRAEIEAYYKNGIRSLIADAVDVEFNKISFLLRNSSTSHNAVLTYNAKTKEYTLSYEGYYTNNETKEITAPNLNALKAEMRKNKTDFDEAGIRTVEDNAALMPAVCLGAQSMDDIIVILTNFYTSPNTRTYNAVKDVYVLYELTWVRSGNNLFGDIAGAYINTVLNLSQSLAQKVADDVQASRGIVVLSTEQQQRLVNMQD